MVSAGELHYPGLPFDKQDPKLFKGLARLTKNCYDRERPSGVKVEAGPCLLTPGLTEADFDEMAELVRSVSNSSSIPMERFRARMSNMSHGRRNGAWWSRSIQAVFRDRGKRSGGADLILRLKPDV